MKNNESRRLLTTIQQKTGKTIAQVAQDIKLSRAYFNNAVANGGNNNIVKLLKETYPDILVEEKPKETVVPKTMPAIGINPYIALLEERVKELKEDKEYFKRTLEFSLSGLSMSMKSILAHVATSLEKDNEREAAGNKKKEQALKDETDRRIVSKLGAGKQMDIHEGN